MEELKVQLAKLETSKKTFRRQNAQLKGKVHSILRINTQLRQAVAKLEDESKATSNTVAEIDKQSKEQSHLWNEFVDTIQANRADRISSSEDSDADLEQGNISNDIATLEEGNAVGGPANATKAVKKKRTKGDKTTSPSTSTPQKHNDKNKNGPVKTVPSANTPLWNKSTTTLGGIRIFHMTMVGRMLKGRDDKQLIIFDEDRRQTLMNKCAKKFKLSSISPDNNTTAMRNKLAEACGQLATDLLKAELKNVLRNRPLFVHGDVLVSNGDVYDDVNAFLWAQPEPVKSAAVAAMESFDVHLMEDDVKWLVAETIMECCADLLEDWRTPTRERKTI